MKKEMLINVLQPEECRIAILENGVLEELYVERTSHESYVGNIYKGRVVNIEPSIQAAFVDFGVGRNGFLHVSDVEPQYYRADEPEENGEGSGRKRGRGGRGRKPLADLPELPDVEESEIEDVADDDESDTEVAGNGGSEVESPTDALRDESDPTAIDDDLDELGDDSEDGDPDALDNLGDDLNGPDDLDEAEADDDNEGDMPRRMPSAERHTDEEDDGRGFAEGLGLELAPAPPSRSPAHPEPPVAAPPIEETAERRPPPRRERGRAPAGRKEPPRRELPRPAEEPARPEPPPLEMIDARAEIEDDGDDDGRHGRGRRGRKRRPLPTRDGFNARPKPPIQEIFRRGQEVLVQVIKEGIGTKGPTLSTYISIPGRYLVLMPGLNRIGVSRKIMDEDQRRRLREVLGELNPPKGLGFIIRTAGLDRTKKELQRDLAYLARLWKVVVRRIKKSKAPALIYEESDLITRTIRDIFTPEIETIRVDKKEAYEHAQEFLQIVMPRYANRIQLYEEREPLFHRYKIEEEIARIQRRHVPLPNGGSIVIDQTEALVAIDVNSGNFRADNNAEETAFRMNLQAAKEIARQLRLRDLGGVIVNDFIDMREERHRRDVERALREAVKRDRARTKVLRMSQFGIIEMTRQRIRPSLKRSVYEDCHHCSGTGQVKTCESMSIDVMRLLQLAAHRERIAKVDVRVTEAVAHYLLNKRRRELAQLEEPGKLQVTITGSPTAAPETLELSCYDGNGSELKLLPNGR